MNTVREIRPALQRITKNTEWMKEAITQFHQLSSTRRAQFTGMDAFGIVGQDTEQGIRGGFLTSTQAVLRSLGIPY